MTIDTSKMLVGMAGVATVAGTNAVSHVTSLSERIQVLQILSLVIGILVGIATFMSVSLNVVKTVKRMKLIRKDGAAMRRETRK